MRRDGLFERMPLLPMAVSLIVGLTASPLGPATAMLVVLLCVAVAASWMVGRWPSVQFVAITVCFVLLGMVVGRTRVSSVPDGVPTEAVIVGELSERPKTLMTDLLLTKTGERRRCYIWKDERSRHLSLGDALVVSISDGRFVRWNDWRGGGNGRQQMSRVERLRLKALQLRHTLLQRFKTADADADAYAVLAAMSLGDKGALTAELRETYSVTGASHVLALSGLHLGIIYMLLIMLLPHSRRSMVAQLVAVLALWAFAFITGLSPSVVRSASMISLFAVFSLGDRRRSSVNVLCFTAMVMLLVSPSSLSDVGFQLSFMAVLSILLWKPVLDKLVSQRWLLSHSVARWAWGLATVSVAAQLGVAPLIAYYFGRFSTYFLLTNFIVIPAATLILYGALAVLVVPAFGSVLLWFVAALNSVLGTMSQLPGASIDGLHPSVIQVVIIYTLIAVVYAISVRMLKYRNTFSPYI